MKFQKRQTKASPGDYSLTILSLATAKTYLLLGAGTSQDAIITSLIKAGVDYIEAGLDYYINTSGLIYQHYDSFPAEGYLPIWHRYIKETDLVVNYWDGSAWAVFDDDNYRIDTKSTPPKVFLKADKSWPDLTNPDSFDMVRVGFKVDTSNSFFEELTASVMTYVAARYENREGDWNSSIMINNVHRFIERHKLHS